MLKLFLKSKIKAIVKSNEVLACATDFTNIYIQPKFIEDENLNEKQVALLILNSCVHTVLKHDRYEKNIMNSVFRDRFVNRYLEKKFPEFIGLTKSMSGVI